MKSGSSSLSIRDALAQLAQLLDEPWTDQGDQRQAALVVRLSARSYDPDEAPPPELRNAIASLVDAVEKYLLLEADLAGEAAQDLGGEG